MNKQPLDLGQLLPELELITDENLRQLVADLWTTLWSESSWEQIEDVPVSLKIDYPQIKHCRGIARAAVAAAEAFESVHDVTFDRDLLVAGALLMDAGKLVETCPAGDGKAAKTELGNLIPHAGYAAHLALARGADLRLVHILMCHSPNAGKAPETLECKLLDWLDQADISVFGWDIWRRRVVHFQP